MATIMGREKYQIAIITICAIIIALTASASGNDISELRKSVFSFEDPKITVQDLAFFLATHNYDATPRDGYVELQLNGECYRLVPNGDAPGLCDIEELKG